MEGLAHVHYTCTLPCVLCYSNNRAAPHYFSKRPCPRKNPHPTLQSRPVLLKALLKDSLVKILQENPPLLHLSEDAGPRSRSGKLSLQCLFYGLLVFACCGYVPGTPSVGEAQWSAGQWRGLLVSMSCLSSMMASLPLVSTQGVVWVLCQTQQWCRS